MQKPSRKYYAAAGFFTAIALAFAACGTPTRPTNLPVSRAVINIEIAPRSVGPGESVQMVVNATRVDGTVENVTSATTWQVGTPSVLQISATGVATGKARGETLVSATYSEANSRQTSTFRLFVLPKDTFRLRGTIRDSGFGIANVKVTVVSGIGETLETVSATGGTYSLYGVRGPISLHLKKDGYLTGIEQLNVIENHDADFNMSTDRPVGNYAGAYTLTLTAGAVCNNGIVPPLPDAM